MVITEVDYCPETGDRPGGPMCRCGARAIAGDAARFCTLCKAMYVNGMHWNEKTRGWCAIPPAGAQVVQS